MLDEERALFENKHQEWLAAYPGKFVLIKGSEVIGFFDNQEDAMVEGVLRFGLVPFLVRSVADGTQEISIPAIASGVFDANPSYRI